LIYVQITIKKKNKKNPTNNTTHIGYLVLTCHVMLFCGSW